MATTLNQSWDLDRFFEGGSASSTLAAYLDDLEGRFVALRAAVSTLGADADAWAPFLDHADQALKRLTQAGSQVYCLMSQDVRDRQAVILDGRIAELYAASRSLFTLMDERIRAIPDAEWRAILSDPRIEPVAFSLMERRTQAFNRMDTARELLANDLAIDGYHALDTLYQTVVGRITIPFGGEELSVGQAYNRFSDPDRAKRQALFTQWEAAWGKDAELCAYSLNHLAGFRLNLYKHRGWDSVLKEPLQLNRMSRETLEAMWAAVNSSKEKLKLYLDRKAKLMGAQRMAWYDLEAPINSADRKVSYEEAAAFIEEQFRKFSPAMADFAAAAFRDRWIEAEDRPHKAPGGYCTSFPESRVSRIFMTFSGDAGGVTTLAHELGHAYHSHVMFDLPALAQDYAMNVAETASTFAEMLVSSAAIKAAATREEKVALLNNRLGEATAYLMNIHARFLFETRFYERRAKGLLSIPELNALMETAQREAYRDALETYHPLFWASKGHFYGTSMPFYNFPYTFGYLFSAGIYARAMAEGPAFERKYVELLRDTGRMTVEELGRRHLGVDLTRPDFWESGLTVAFGDVDQFLQLTDA
ncbi:MAG: M3 family oligoendopeptidase [Bacillota bacterium]